MNVGTGISGGSEIGSGTTLISAGVVANVTGTFTMDLGRSFVNNGTMNWTGGTLNSGCCDATRGYAISNTGSWIVGASSSLSYNTGCCTGSVTTFTNSGTVTKIGSGQLTINSSFANSGTATVNAGILTLAGGDAGGTTGGYPVASGATLDFGGGSFNFTSGLGVTGAGSGHVDGNNPTVTFAAPYSLTNLTESSGTATFNAGSGLSPTSMALSGGTLNVNLNASVSSLTQSGGTLTGSGTPTLTSTATSGGGIAATWNGGAETATTCGTVGGGRTVLG